MLSLPRPLILASQSPRRYVLLRQLGLEFSVQPSAVVEELLPLDLPPHEYAAELARLKAAKGEEVIKLQQKRAR